MLVLIVGLVLFLGIHTLPVAPDLQGRLRAGIGENGYKGLFSLASTLGLILIVWGVALSRGNGANVQIWNPPVWTKHLAFLLMWPAFILLVAAYVPSRIRDSAKHPMLAAVKIWALAHLLANGDLAGMILFAAFLAWAVVDRISVKRRDARGPLGRKPGTPRGDAIAVIAGSAAYILMLVWGHPWLIGRPLLPYLSS